MNAAFHIILGRILRYPVFPRCKIKSVKLCSVFNTEFTAIFYHIINDTHIII